MEIFSLFREKRFFSCTDGTVDCRIPINKLLKNITIQGLSVN